MTPRQMSRALRLLTLVCASATALHAQGGGCDIELRPANDLTRLTSTASMPNGPRTVFVGGRVEARCLNQDVRLLADSAEWYQQAQVLYLIGNVVYTEPRVRVSSSLMNYFQADERVVATGNVEATLPSGSIMRGPEATYYRGIRGVRSARLIATQRPRLWITQRDSVGKSSEPVQITANQITTENDSLVFAGGKVEITRSDLDARSDSAFLDSGKEFARLMILPVIIGKGERGYKLRGKQVELYTRNRLVQRVLAQGEARATSEDLLLTADTIDLRVDQNRAQAAYVWGKSRARAISPDRDLIADSLAVRMPDQQLREVRAFTNAVATTMPDTATVRTAEKDWLKGDTIVSYFDSTARAGGKRVPPKAAPTIAPSGVSAPSAPATRPTGRQRSRVRDTVATATQPTPTVADSAQPADSAEKPRLRELRAMGHASARYQVQAQGSPPERPGINYSRGNRITVTMDSTGVSRVQIDENAVGLYLEPTPQATPPTSGDSTSIKAPTKPPVPPGSAPTSAGTPARKPEVVSQHPEHN
jgi:lipopolysaccharide export system protein LptA